MPHAVFEPGIQTASDEFGAARKLIPGIEPGGSRAGGETKPALLITDVWAEWLIGAVQDTTVNTARLTVALKFSQEQTGDPGLLLPIATFLLNQAPAGVADPAFFHQENYGHHYIGKIFAPAWVGIASREASSAPLNHLVRVHLDYEVIQVPWMDWFIMWEWLDGIQNLDLEY